jgi:hypothetical protein
MSRRKKGQTVLLLSILPADKNPLRRSAQFPLLRAKNSTGNCCTKAVNRIPAGQNGTCAQAVSANRKPLKGSRSIGAAAHTASQTSGERRLKPRQAAAWLPEECAGHLHPTASPKTSSDFSKLAELLWQLELLRNFRLNFPEFFPKDERLRSRWPAP